MKKSKGHHQAKRAKKIRVHQTIIHASGRQERAEYCTRYLETFESACRDWVDLALILTEVERDKLFLEVGAKSWDEWARVHAPASYRLCYMIKARYKALKEAFSDAELKRMPPETASWASRARNISPGALSQPKVKEALMLPYRKAIAVLKEALPDEHIEDMRRVACKFAVSQHAAVMDGYEAFKELKDEKASFEEFVEFAVSEWMESLYEEGRSVRQCWSKGAS